MNTNQETQQTPVASTRNIIPLEAIHVASPCKASWAKMQGDDASRFCGSCEKHVYNLSAMTRAEAENLVAEKEGKLCVRFYQREDGTMLTSDCKVGAAALGMRLANSRFAPLRVLAGLACALGAMLPNATQAKAAGLVDTLRVTPGVGAALNCIAPQVMGGATHTAPAKPKRAMGKIAMPTKPKTAQKKAPIMGKPMPPRMGEIAPTMGIMAPLKTPHTPRKMPKAVAKKVAPKTSKERRNAAKKIVKARRGA